MVQPIASMFVAWSGVCGQLPANRRCGSGKAETWTSMRRPPSWWSGGIRGGSVATRRSFSSWRMGESLDAPGSDASTPGRGLTRRQVLAQVLAATAGAVVGAPLLSSRASAPAAVAAPKLAGAVRGAAWEQVPLGTNNTLFDLDFSGVDPQHGWLVGTRGLVLETTDGGTTWKPRTFRDLEKDEELEVRFEMVHFWQDEGWVIGKPATMLHTADGGRNWLRVPLSPKLPGAPARITALGKDKAELVTTAGAVYLTENGGRNWRAQVRETIDATLNRTISSGVTGSSYYTGSIVSVQRDVNGNYVAVSSRGNFFLSWTPGNEFWVPHARASARRISGLGFVRGDVRNGLWETIHGGGLGFTKPGPDLNSTDMIDFQMVDAKTGGYGILDVASADEQRMWAAVGGGNMFRSDDGGKTWRRDPLVQRVGGNLYRIKFYGPERGFVLGANGILLKYNPDHV
ncbi:hypothetical protein CDCA_CDCA05G1566 [Cyanidium caldarium]|uniref:Photosynthesis system II assembly factor Ycf48/Hcf136-like domain-containing protein n=1 Tax=Cyanidium caldarium TaxID=2771 RepID=A0AAV9IU01_CYACA|nr:hypothetical protein CDCA_CDCA05G1566 [Cyanidium caldarium]